MLQSVIQEHIQSYVVSLTTGETIVDGRSQEGIQQTVSKELAIFRLGFRDLMTLPQGQYDSEDIKAYETSKALLNALSINGLTTLALKGLVRTRSPNGDSHGWPSGHTSSTFCLATVMHEAYGPWVGIPLFAFASYVGYERIDARNHDFSDVLSGALIGMAIGHAVMQNHKPKVFGFELVPWLDPQGSVGVALTKRF